MSPPILDLRPVNTQVFSVHLHHGTHVGNLKRVGSVWKFKAIGYEDGGALVPGGGPLTHRHNTQLPQADAQLLAERLFA